MSNFRFTRNDNFPPIIKNLIIINVLVWVAQLMYDQQYDLTGKLALWPVHDEEFKPYQFVTHMFAHASVDIRGRIVFMHIFFNMFALWMFGRILENIWGHKRFLFFYLACGIGAAICHELVQYIRYEQAISLRTAADNFQDAVKAESMLATLGPAVGASGAVMGVMVAFAMLFPNTELYMMFIPIPIKAKWAVLAFVALDLFGGFGNFSGDKVAHFAHLGGALTGFIIVMIWNKKNRRTLY